MSRRLVPPVRINEAILLIILIWLVGMYKRGAHSNKKKKKKGPKENGVHC